jgi:3-hydroxyacyl-CoA dehydrogenase
VVALRADEQNLSEEECMDRMAEISRSDFEEIRTIAVLGAGTMGSRIAAHIANAGYPVLLLDIVGKDNRDRSSIARQALEGLKKARPAAFVDTSVASLVTVGNFEDDLHRLGDADWIIEAVAEQMPIKRSLLTAVAPHLRPDAILTTNTSGLPIAEIASVLPEPFRARFFGTHFFNPPRYMTLLEMIPTTATDPNAYEAIARFSEVHLGKTVVPAKDRPNFIANRIGTFAVMNTMRLMREQDLTIEEVDVLTGSLLGWPKTGTFRLADLVGVDVLVHVARNFALSTTDERADVTIDPVMEQMLSLGLLGDKAGRGFYRKTRTPEGSEQRTVLNLSTLEYEPTHLANFPELAGIKASESASDRIPALLRPEPIGGRAGAFYWAMLSELFAYAANRVGEVSDSVADIDLAMRAGFNWQLGPFGLWDAAGVPETVARMRSLGQAVPDVVERLLKCGGLSWYRNDGAEFFDPTKGIYVPVRASPRAVSIAKAKSKGIVKENASASLVDLGDGVACIEVHSKMNTLGHEAVEFIREVLTRDSDATGQFQAFVIANDGAHFSTGANLAEAVNLIQREDWASIDRFIANFQAMTAAIKFCSRPVVAAPFGMCLGGGAEIALYAASRQAHTDVAMGLVEAGVGLIPAGGGCKEMTLRAIETAAEVRSDLRGDSPEVHKAIATAFEMIAMAKVSGSAVEAKRLHLLRRSDAITANRSLLVADAKAEALRLAEQGYTPPVLRTDIPAPGQPALALLELSIYMLREGAFISDHDVVVSKHAAHVLCGGAVMAGTLLDENYLLGLEREAFLSLSGEPKTKERIVFTLKTGKPLRN